MRVLIAPDKFKGTATAREVANALAAAVDAHGATAVIQVLADGGEGTLDALGGANRTLTVAGPLGHPVSARWRLGRARTAVVEMAEAAGLQLVGGADGNDPLAASTAGVGELIGAAMQGGARHIIVAVGGSASTDGGWGAVQALASAQRLRGVELVVACDVRTTFVDAAEVFAPQKGASVAQVELLRRRLVRLAQVYETERGIDVREIPGSGAAGGLAGGLASLGAKLVPGFEVVADAVDLYGRIEAVDLVVTGEGTVDTTSFDGKVVGGVCDLAAEAGVPVVVIAGAVAADTDTPCVVHSLVDHVGMERAMEDTGAAITAVATEALEPLLGPTR